MNDRVEQVLEAVRERELDALLVTDLHNLRWLTGFTGSNGLALVGPEVRRFVTDFRYLTQARDEVGEEWGQAEIANDALARAVEAGLPARVGFEDDHLTVKQHAKLSELAGEDVELVAAGGLVEELRLVKEPGEIELIRAAARVADEAFR